jgi:flavin-dependent dehydrogenase
VAALWLGGREDGAGSINPLWVGGMSMGLRSAELLAPWADRFLHGEIQGEDWRRTMVGTSAFAAALDAVGAQFVYRMALVRAGGFAVEPR